MRMPSAFAGIVYGGLRSLLGIATPAMIFICVGAAPVAAQEPLSMDQSIAQVAEQLATALRGQRRLRVAVPDLLDLRGGTTLLGRYVAERLQTRLATEASWFTLMERRRVGQVLDELNFGAYDLIQATNARRFGRMIGVDAILVGTLSALPGRVDIDVRIVDIESSAVLSAAQATMLRTSAMASWLVPIREDTARLGEMAAGAPTGPERPRAVGGIVDSAPQTETRAVQVYQRACDRGDLLGCVNLGSAYAAGRGVARSDTRAVELYQQACGGAEVSGCAQLATMYFEGRGVAQSDTRAVELHRRACDGEVPPGCEHLGAMYETGRGVPQSFTRAADLYRRACDDGSMVACGLLGIVYAAGRGVARSDTRAVEAFQRACDGAEMSGCRILGLMYQTGNGVARDSARADQLLRRACHIGDSPVLRQRAARSDQLLREAYDDDGGDLCNRLRGASRGARP